jgi:Aspartate/tyrosine/aromatic aminotransferase
MTGWRLGYIAAKEKKLNAILKIHQYSTTCSPTFIQMGAAMGMDTSRTREEVAFMKESFSRRRILLMNGLDQIAGLSYIVPGGAFYLMADVGKTGLTGMEYASKLLEEEQVAVIPAVGLGRNCSEFIRISFAASEENIGKALEKIRSFTEKLLAGKSGNLL